MPLPRWVKRKTDDAVSSVLHTARSNELPLGPYCTPLLFHLPCVLILLDLPAFLMLPCNFSYFLSFPQALPHSILRFFWKCSHIVWNLKGSKGYRAVCPSLGLPVSLHEEPSISFLSVLSEVCFTYPNKQGNTFSYAPQTATHYTQCCEPCFFVIHCYLRDHDLSVCEASFFMANILLYHEP